MVVAIPSYRSVCVLVQNAFIFVTDGADKMIVPRLVSIHPHKNRLRRVQPHWPLAFAISTRLKRLGPLDTGAGFNAAFKNWL